MIRKMIICSLIFGMYLLIAGCQPAVTHERHEEIKTETIESEEIIVE